MIRISIASLEPQSTLGAFLRMLRRRVPPRSDTLGPSKRLPIRRGRRVTQEEIAEAVGISRNWYRRLEGGASARASNEVAGSDRFCVGGNARREDNALRSRHAGIVPRANARRFKRDCRIFSTLALAP